MQDQLCRPSQLSKPFPAHEKDKAKVRKQIHRGWVGPEQRKQHGDRSWLFSELRAKKFTFPLCSFTELQSRDPSSYLKKRKKKKTHNCTLQLCLPALGFKPPPWPLRKNSFYQAGRRAWWGRGERRHRQSSPGTRGGYRQVQRCTAERGQQPGRGPQQVLRPPVMGHDGRGVEETSQG